MILSTLSGFPGGTSGEEPVCQSKRWRFDPWVRKIPWRRVPAFFCLENTMDRGAWRATIHRVAKSWTQLKWLGMHMRSTISGWASERIKCLSAVVLPGIQLTSTVLTGQVNHQPLFFLPHKPTKWFPWPHQQVNRKSCPRLCLYSVTGMSPENKSVSLIWFRSLLKHPVTWHS